MLDNNMDMRLINAGSVNKPKSPLVNWDRLNERGKEERATEILANAGLHGALHGAGHAVYKEATTGESVTPGEQVRHVTTGAVLSVAKDCVKDTYDTITDQPNRSGTYMDGGPNSSVQKRYLGPNGERVNHEKAEQ